MMPTDLPTRVRVAAFRAWTLAHFYFHVASLEHGD
jgi:hypothetical protein